MSDNVTANAGSGGPVFLAEDTTGNGGPFLPLAKVSYGAHGVNTPVTVTTALPVQPGTGVTFPVSFNTQAIDGSTTITAANAPQSLFAGTVPTNGFAVYNSDPTNDCWISDSTLAAVNGVGSIRVAANGGGYETPVGYKPIGGVSITGAVTGQKITARRW